MRLHKLFFSVIIFTLLICMFSSAGFSEQRTVVTVIEGRVICSDIPEELIPTIEPRELKTGIFIKRVNDYSGSVDIKGKRQAAYIPYNLRYELYNKLQPGVLVLLQDNIRRMYGTEVDIIAVAVETVAGSEYVKGETKPITPEVVSELTEIADALRGEIKSEEAASTEEAKGDVVREVTGEVTREVTGEVTREVAEEVITVAKVTPTTIVVAGDEEEQNKRWGPGPKEEEEEAKVAADTAPSSSPPTEPTPPAPAPAAAEYYWVDPINGSNNNDGSSDNPWLTVTYALANADPTVSTKINLVAGTYGTAGAGYNGETFPLNMVTDLDIVGSGSGSTTITGDGTNSVIAASSVTGVDISGVTITGGGGAGCGVRVDNSNVSLSNCVVTYNTSTLYGGGIYATGTSTVTVSDSTVSYNTAGIRGGGIYLGDGVTGDFSNVTVSYNTSTAGLNSSGGGGFKNGAGNFTATDSIFNSNSGGSYGGAIDLYNTSGTINISRCKFTSNKVPGTAVSLGGAGIYILNATGAVTITNCLFADNGEMTKIYGTGVMCDNSSPTIMNCTFANGRTSVDATLTGALHLQNLANPTMTNCIFYGDSSYGIYSDAAGPTATYCDFNSNTGGDTSPASIPDASCIFTNPSFKGPSDYHIGSGSPCIDLGTSTGAPSVDIDGRSRSGNPDIGCYEYTTGDPQITGTVYDSVTGETISSPVVAIYNATTNVQVAVTTSNPYTFNVDPGNYYIALSKSGYGFPSQIVTQAVDGDHGDIFTASESALTINIPMDPDGWLYVEKTVNKKRVTLGEIVTYNIKIRNKHWYKAVENVELVDEIVNGFKYVTGGTYRGSAKQGDPTISSRKAVFNIGTVSANSTINLSYQVRVGTGIPNGRYKASCNTRKSTTGARNSNISSASIDVIEDPLFTRGTIIGKVFNDLNKNGWQDKGEIGIPNVKIATEYGVVVETDSDGKYHIADVPAGNHLLKVDLDAEFTTDNPYFVKMTEGLLAKVNFGVTKNGDSPLKKEGQSPFFIVALAEGIVRNLDTSGNIEMVDKDDRYDDGVHVDGRLALYLKGKVLGKYLITASVDTDRRPYGRYDTRDLFRNLDPDKYYPVYGDASKVDYSASDTQDIVYVMIEWDESFARWGSFHTELPVYNRTLSGGIINYESVGKTKFGDTRTEIKGFGAVSRQKPAHDEFVGTGGSLYYLRHDDVIMGSEKLRVEVRDRIGKTTLNSIPLAEEKDYEIDYDSGRILLRRPLNSIQQAYTSSIISNDILMGERVYLIVDYEYYSDGLSDEAWGGRASQWLGNHIRVGGTYVEEQREGDDNYRIYGGDGTIKINEDTEIIAAYSHSEETQLGSDLSYDGGLTFQEQYDTFSDGLDGDAYSVGGRTKLFNNTDINLTYAKQDPYYSATDSISQQGSEKYIANVTSKLTENLSAGISHITQKYKEETTATQTFADRDVHTTTGILDYRRNKWDLRAEYQHQEVKNPVTTYTYFGTVPLLDNDFIAARIGYQLFQWFHPYIRGQVTVNGEANDQGTVGADITIWEKTNLNLAETVGTQGNSTLVGLTSKVTEDTDVYANLEVGNHMQLGKFTKTTYGQSSLLGPDSKAYVEEDYSSYRENIVRGNLLGYDKKITDTLALGLTYERSNVKNNTTVIDRDAGSVSLAYLNPDWLKADTKLEVRNDIGTTEVRQWVTENDILWRVTESISLTGRGNWGWTTDLDNETDEAEFYELGTGFSLRPVSWDRLNILGKYSYLMNLPPDSQWDFIEDIESRRHVYALEGAFDICRYLQLVGKFAYRDLEEKAGPRDWTDSDTYLYIARTNFHIMNAEKDKPFILRGWDIGVEYRILANDQIEDQKDGFLVELDKDIGDYLRMGVGYNFTDYDDDLRNEDNWDAKGWFVRVNGKY